MDHTQLSILDLGIIAVYLLSMVAVGVYFVRRIKNSGDYYVAGRSLGPLVMMATVCATIIGGSGLMGRAGVAYSSGFKAVMSGLHHDGHRGLPGDGHRHHHQHAGGPGGPQL